MKPDEYWQQLLKSNPSLKNEDCKMTITVATFKHYIFKSFNLATQDNDTKKAAQDFGNVGTKDYSSVFSDIFGDYLSKK